MDPNQEYLDNLISAYLSGTASAEQVSELEDLIVNDEEVIQTFQRHCQVDAALGAIGMSNLHVVSDSSAPQKTKKQAPPKPGKRHPIQLVAIAACLSILGLITALVNRDTGVTIQIVEASGEIENSYKVGQTTKTKHLVMSDGRLKLRLESGVSLEMNGPNETTFHDPMEIELTKGSLTAHVGENGKGFTVKTGTAEIVDLGTRFGVSLSDTGETDVVVMSGLVEVYKPEKPKNRNGELITKLTKGEAIRVDKTFKHARLPSVTFKGNSLASKRRKNDKKPLVIGVTDSIQESDFNRYYSIKPRAMKEGVRAYSTLSKSRWKALPGESFPPELIGADVVGTYSGDRIDKDLQLYLHLSDPATVYIMMDTRSALPDWLTQDYQKTPHQLLCGPWGNSGAAREIEPSEDGNRYVTYQVWKRDIKNGGTVTLGPSYNAKHSRRFAMYGITVQKLSKFQKKAE